LKIARLTESDKETYGIVKNGSVTTKDEIVLQTGVPLPIKIKDFLFDGWYDEVKDKLSELPYKKSLSKFNILAPIPDPSKIICLAFNYSDHASEQKLEPPKEPVIFLKPRTALCGTNSEIICPNFVTQLDYEIELAVILGKTCKNVSENEAKNIIFGYMVFNDVSAREIQFGDKQFTRGKSFDFFAPCGPWITTSDEIANPQNLKLTPKNINSKTNIKFVNYEKKLPTILFSSKFFYIKSWRWIPLSHSEISLLTKSQRIIYFGNENTTDGLAIITDSEHFDKTMMITILSGSIIGLKEILFYIQNLAYEKNFKRIQVLTKLKSLPSNKDLENRLKFYLMKKKI